MCLLTACGETPSDPCVAQPVVAGGVAQVGRGSTFLPVSDGEEFAVELGLQGLYMFVVNARVRDMAVGTENVGGAVWFQARDQAGTILSLDVGCRAREFDLTSDGSFDLASPYFLALFPEFTGVLDGAAVTIRVEVRDRDGLQATDERTVIARLPT